MFSADSLIIFSQLLDAYQIPSAHPQLVDVAQKIVVARVELAVAIEATVVPITNLPRSANGKTTEKGDLMNHADALTNFTAIEIVMTDAIAATRPLIVRVVREDRTVQAEIVVAAGYRLIADEHGVRVEDLLAEHVGP